MRVTANLRRDLAEGQPYQLYICMSFDRPSLVGAARKLLKKTRREYRDEPAAATAYPLLPKVRRSVMSAALLMRRALRLALKTTAETNPMVAKRHQARRLNSNIKSGHLPKFQLTIRLRVHV